jgi:ABC-type nitrate/sulfonate/bicarbonate transport system substrate-binding protein
MSRFTNSIKVLAVVVLSTLVGCTHVTGPNASKIRIGWQVPWATQGQVAQVLKHTNALSLNNLQGEFKGFTYGAPLNEAALAGDVDVIFTADQPAATLLARGAPWTIVARLMYNRVAIYVPPDSDIQTVADLKGKRIAMPFGAAAQRVALKAIMDAGLDPKKDVTSINLDISEQNHIVQAGNRKRWGDIDALVGFDPTPAIFESKGLARMLHIGQVVSLVLISDDFLKQHPNESKRFLEAFVESWYYYATHQNEANDWFRNESRLQVDSHILDVAAAVEPNIQAKTIKDIRPTLNQKDIDTMEEAAKFIRQQGMTNTEVSMGQYYNATFINNALREVTESVKTIQPTQ